MDSFETEEDRARERMQLEALANKNSAYYQGIMRALKEADASAARAKEAKGAVTLPLYLEEVAVAALEKQFGVNIRLRGSAPRAVATPRLAAMMMLVDTMLDEHAGVAGRTVLAVDGDVATYGVLGVDSRIVERTHATARLATGYMLEKEQLFRLRDNKAADWPAVGVFLREMEEGGGEHFWNEVRDNGPKVDTVTVNHFKTPVGPTQVAWLAYCRGAAAIGAFPFQVEMLTRDSGELACFPGTFYVDRKADVLVCVPREDASMAISHPYSMIIDFAMNNSVTVGGKEFLCEKYMNVKGIMYYHLRAVGSDFEAPEVLRTSYYDTSKLGVTKLSYPCVKFSAEGVPVGVTRGETYMLTSRFEKVNSRVMTSANSIVHPREVFVALMDYNNMVFNSLDNAVRADRMSVEDESAVAVGIALLVNWRRHAARGTFNELMKAVKLRHEVADANIFKMVFLAATAWWSRCDVRGMQLEEALPEDKVVDWCGNDFSVLVRDVDPWVEAVQVVGKAEEMKAREVVWFPKPKVERDEKWYRAVLSRAIAATMPEKLFPRPVKMAAGWRPGKSSVVGTPMVVQTSVCANVQDRPVELSDLKASLKKKQVAEQGASCETCLGYTTETFSAMSADAVGTVPVIDVEPRSAIAADIAAINGGLPERDVVTTGYRLAETEIVKNAEGVFSINDSKRQIPAQKWVRRPLVDVGAEGKRVACQATLLGAGFKRNVGIPNNRGSVELDAFPDLVVDRLIETCFKDDWQSIVNKHLETGLWEPNAEDIESFLSGVDEKKAQRMLDEFFLEGQVDLSRWLLMAKGKVKPSRGGDTDAKADHPQTIMYLDSSSTNAMYSAITRRFKKCLDECLRPNISLNSQQSVQDHEEWYNELEGVRRSFPATVSYAADIKTYDRSQETVGLKCETRLYSRMGLTKERLAIWEQTHGPKKAASMMFGVIISMVWGGVSGLWKTLLRNGVINLMALLMATDIDRASIVMLDIKGDDMDAEFSRTIAVESAVERMSLTFNLSAKFFTNDVRYMCKEFRLRINGRWCFVADPWARIQSALTPIWVGNQNDTLAEKWISMKDDLRGYDNGLRVDAVAEAAQQYYGLPIVPYGLARSLAKFVSNRASYFTFFHPPELVG